MNGATFSAIDLSSLPAPDVVEALDYETILGAMKQDLVARDPSFSALLESDPAMKVLEVAAYRELNLRQHINDSARAVMLAHAVGSDLDNLAALVPLQRKVLDPGDSEAMPPISPTYESDDDFRRRIQLAPEGFSVAGASGGYVYHALAVSEVKDASVSSPNPGEVTVYVLSHSGDGSADAALVESVHTTVNSEEVRPLTDHVTVRSAEILPVDVTATLYLQPGPSAQTVLDAARKSIEQLAATRHCLGAGLPLSAVYAALHQEGVRAVALSSPAADIACASHQAVYCTAITLEQADA